MPRKMREAETPVSPELHKESVNVTIAYSKCSPFMNSFPFNFSRWIRFLDNFAGVRCKNGSCTVLMMNQILILYKMWQYLLYQSRRVFYNHLECLLGKLNFYPGLSVFSSRVSPVYYFWHLLVVDNTKICPMARRTCQIQWI